MELSVITLVSSASHDQGTTPANVNAARTPERAYVEIMTWSLAPMFSTSSANNVALVPLVQSAVLRVLSITDIGSS